MRQLPRVALLLPSAIGGGRAVLQGIGAYIQSTGPWIVFHRPGEPSDSVSEQLRIWRPDGVIAHIDNPQVIQQLRRMRVPTIDLFACRKHRGIPRILIDSTTVARMVADFFLERGYQHFAYCGSKGGYPSEMRRRAFLAHLAKVGRRAEIYEAPRISQVNGTLNFTSTGNADLERMGAWLQSLPRPLAVLAGSDVRGLQLVTACNERAIVVPEEVAIVAVGNDEVVCNLCCPTLSSVELGTERIGYEAAALLDRMLHGLPPPTKETRFPPIRIVTRGTTESLAMTDPDLAAALQFIRKHYTAGISVQDVADHVALSARTLQRRFTAVLHRAPHDEIARLQVQRVKEMLAATELPLQQIALLTGFSHLESMCRLFRRRTGVSPGQFRRHTQGRSPEGRRGSGDVRKG